MTLTYADTIPGNMALARGATDVWGTTVLRVCDQLEQGRHCNHPEQAWQLVVYERGELLEYCCRLLSEPC